MYVFLPLFCSMIPPGDALRSAIERALPVLHALTDERASLPVAPGKWCPKEILGHLLDSANNNLARFVRLQATDHLLFEPYDQEAWVHAQAYGQVPWPELMDLWARYNRHIAHVMDRVPSDALDRPRPRHTPPGNTYAPLPSDGRPTLRWLMDDYVAHLWHHIRQIAAVAGQA